MEQEQSLTTIPEPDREQFERVWRRVMPQNRPDCPFTLRSPGESAPAAQSRLMPGDGEMPGPILELGLAPMVPMTPAPMLRAGPPIPAPAPAMPLPNDGELLQKMISGERADECTYRTMARRSKGENARIFQIIANQEGQHARRLSAAYFLLTGVRFWPDSTPAEPMGTFLGWVRQRFLCEKRGEAAYRAAAERVEDFDLKELFSELALEEAYHAALLRKIVERM